MYRVISSLWDSKAETEYCAMQPKDCKTVGMFLPQCRESTSPWRETENRLDYLFKQAYLKIQRQPIDMHLEI